MSEPQSLPNPGSPEAMAQGCTCPRMDNANGKGAGLDEDGTPLFWRTHGCPVHPASGVGAESEKP